MKHLGTGWPALKKCSEERINSHLQKTPPKLGTRAKKLLYLLEAAPSVTTIRFVATSKIGERGKLRGEFLTNNPELVEVNFYVEEVEPVIRKVEIHFLLGVKHLLDGMVRLIPVML